MKKFIILSLLLSFSIIISFSQTDDLTEGLVAYYPFTGNADDVTGNGHDGVVYGNLTLTTDRFGNLDSAYEFDGIDDYINTYSTFDLENRSLSLWIKPYSVVGSGGNGNNTLTHVAITQDASSLEYGCLRVDIDDANLKLWAGGAYGTYTYTPLNVYEWYHLVLVRKGERTRYYINGEEVFESIADDTGSTFNPNDNFIIGCGRSTSNQFYQGKIDDVMIYDRLLHSSEVLQIYEGETLINSEGIVINNFVLYPNPTDGIISIENKDQLNIIVDIYDSLGKKIISKTTKTRLLTININSFQEGVYLLKINSNNISATEKIILVNHF